MSSIAIKWVSELTVGNQTAKQLLQFLSVHSFHKPGFFFKLETIASQMEVSVRAIQKAFKLLEDKKLIIKEYRFHKETGRQTTNGYYFNIPDQYTEKYFGEGELRSSLGVNYVQGEGELRSPGVAEKSSNSSVNSKACEQQEIPNSNSINSNINSNYKGGRKPAKKKSPSKVPSDFSFLPSHQEMAVELGLDVRQQQAIFIDYYKSNGKKMVNWNACFRNWLRKAQEFKKNKKPLNNFDEVMSGIYNKGRTFDESGSEVHSEF